jgi:hypothetical protein
MYESNSNALVGHGHICSAIRLLHQALFLEIFFQVRSLHIYFKCLSQYATQGLKHITIYDWKVHLYKS